MQKSKQIPHASFRFDGQGTTHYFLQIFSFISTCILQYFKLITWSLVNGFYLQILPEVVSDVFELLDESAKKCSCKTKLAASVLERVP